MGRFDEYQVPPRPTARSTSGIEGMAKTFAIKPDHERRTAEATKSMDTKLSDLVGAMHQTIEINQQAQAAAARSERFSRRMSVASLWVSIGSLAAALGSIVIAIVALLNTH